MNQETARAQTAPRIESIPFTRLPHQTKLFLEYLNDPLSLRNYYPNAVASPADIRGFAGEVLANYKTDRTALCDALAEINRGTGAGEETLSNIDLLRRSDSVAVVTGQQAGLFTGPLYTIYKALSAIKMAQTLNAAGTPAVPVFWVASEDHDLDEVAKASVIDDGKVVDAQYKPAKFVEDSPVGDVMIDAEITGTIDELLGSLPVRDDIAASWSPGTSFATAFARDLLSHLGKFGLVVIDPLNEEIKQLASTIYVQAIESSNEMVDAIRSRSSDLVASGYHAQVLVEEDYFPLFLHTDDGRRAALRKIGDDVYRAKGEAREFSSAELRELAAREPERFSPGVMLRSVVQDYLLPTICYFGGGAEVAYFAQNSETYRVLGRPVTPVFHRQSFTVIEPKQQRILDKLGTAFEDIFRGVDAVLKTAVERVVSPETADLFVDVEAKINAQLDRMDEVLLDLDPTIAANHATRRKKISYHLAALKKKAYAAKLNKEAIVERHVRSLFNALLPNGELQERVINLHSYLAKYGDQFIDQLYDAVDLDDRGHRLFHV